jgi:type IV pilus assembly protein PilF
MVRLVGRFRIYGRGALLLLGVAGAALLLPGCATDGGVQASEATSSVVTPSDESDVRKRARIRLELAAKYFENGQATVALDEVKQALVTDPTYADALNMRGLIYMQLNDLPQAEDSFRRALAMRPNDANLLHNYGWLACRLKRYADADQQFDKALANPAYVAKSKTLMAKGLCQSGAGKVEDAEQSFLKSYQLDAGNPVVSYHLASLMFRRQELTRAQFYIRRLNNGNYANAESLWLGIKVEKALGDNVAMQQLADQLRKRFPESAEMGAYQRGAFNE